MTRRSPAMKVCYDEVRLFHYVRYAIIFRADRCTFPTRRESNSEAVESVSGGEPADPAKLWRYCRQISGGSQSCSPAHCQLQTESDRNGRNGTGARLFADPGQFSKILQDESRRGREPCVHLALRSAMGTRR